MTRAEGRRIGRRLFQSVIAERKSQCFSQKETVRQAHLEAYEHKTFPEHMWETLKELRSLTISDERRQFLAVTFWRDVQELAG